jgi:hypothetical protein
MDLLSCLPGRWIRYLPDRSWTIYEFNSDAGVIFAPENPATIHFNYVLMSDEELVLEFTERAPARYVVSSPHQYMLLLTAVNQEETFTLYRVQKP